MLFTDGNKHTEISAEEPSFVLCLQPWRPQNRLMGNRRVYLMSQTDKSRGKKLKQQDRRTDVSSAPEHELKLNVSKRWTRPYTHFINLLSTPGGAKEPKPDQFAPLTLQGLTTTCCMKSWSTKRESQEDMQLCLAQTWMNTVPTIINKYSNKYISPWNWNKKFYGNLIDLFHLLFQSQSTEQKKKTLSVKRKNIKPKSEISPWNIFTEWNCHKIIKYYEILLLLSAFFL